MGNIILRSTLLGLGLSMDAGAVAIANGMKYRDMAKRSMLFISFLFGFFQGGMPLLGYWIGRAILAQIQEFLPWLALLILGFLGGNMLYGSSQSDTKAMKKLTPFFCILQAIATSIDALSIGITIVHYTLIQAIICAAIIMGVTMIISFLGIYLGKRFGLRFKGIAEGIGGLILIGIGIEIFLKGRGI